MKIVAGLGNPGRRYRRTRHNMGYRVVEALADGGADEFRVSRFQGLTAEVRLAGHKVLLLKPTTYMNLSGESVAPAARYHKVDPVDCLVVVDDMDLPVGRIRVRARGGHGGHKGLKSVFEGLGTSDVPRLRVGIGRAPDRDGVDHVLGRVAEDEEAAVEAALARAADAVRVWAAEGVGPCMNRFNSAMEPEEDGNRSDDVDGKYPSE